MDGRGCYRRCAGHRPKQIPWGLKALGMTRRTGELIAALKRCSTQKLAGYPLAGLRSVGRARRRSLHRLPVLLEGTGPPAYSELMLARNSPFDLVLLSLSM